MCDDHTHDHDHRTHPAPTPGLRAELTRRGILSAAGSGLLMASLGGPALGAVSTGATLATGASRTSRLTRGTTLLHADLHNHSLMSDGDGDPAAAFAMFGVYRERVDQHLRIGMRAIELLRQLRLDELHSRKLRSFAEVAFQ